MSSSLELLLTMLLCRLPPLSCLASEIVSHPHYSHFQTHSDLVSQLNFYNVLACGHI